MEAQRTMWHPTVARHAVLAAALSLGLSACFSYEITDRVFVCVDDTDCISGYECRTAGDGRSTCQLIGTRPDVLDCAKVYFTASGMLLTVHFPDGETRQIQVSSSGLPAEGTVTTAEGAYSTEYRGKPYGLLISVEAATRLVKARIGDCPFKCIGPPSDDYNPAMCVDEDCDGYGEGEGCKGEDLPDSNGVVDANSFIHPGAEELCDGEDNDGNGATDSEDDAFEAAPCPRQVGVCAGAVQLCIDGALQMCDYGPDYAPQETDAHCDGLDNDCDGDEDEECACQEGETRPCGSVVGVCERGEESCVDGQWGECVGGIDASEEICDGLDNDCDNQVDEHPDNINGDVCGATCPAFDTIPIVATVDSEVVTICVDRWEASQESEGSRIPVSRPGRTPWTNITFADAQMACALMHKALCPIEVWQTACMGLSPNEYPYGAEFQDGVCNGNSPAGGALPTGERAECVSQWEGRGGNDAVGLLYDMSGNVKEWVAPPSQSPGDRFTMGGSWESGPAQLTCTGQESYDNTTTSPQIGFRCCSRLE